MGIKQFAIFWFYTLLFLVVLAPPTETKAKVVEGEIITPGAALYAEPNFDSEVIGYLKKSEKVKVSPKLINLAFFKIKTKSQKIGYVTNLDIDFPNKPQPPKGPFASEEDGAGGLLNSDLGDPLQKSILEDTIEEKSDPKILEERKYLGMRYFWQGYKEKVLGRTRASQLNGVGISFQGAGWLDVLGFVDFGFQWVPKLPSYYESALGRSQRGWLGFGYFLLGSSMNLGSKLTFHYGFGPVIRALMGTLEAQTTNNQSKEYDVAQWVLGGSTVVGLGWHTRRWMIRGDWQFYWEKQQYSALSLGLQWALP